MSKQWCVYMVCCSDGTLYTGITNEIDRRIAEHNGAVPGGARYTRSRRPVELAYLENVENRSAAAKQEYRIKKMTVFKKRKLIAGREPDIKA